MSCLRTLWQIQLISFSTSVLSLSSAVQPGAGRWLSVLWLDDGVQRLENIFLWVTSWPSALAAQAIERQLDNPGVLGSSPSFSDAFYCCVHKSRWTHLTEQTRGRKDRTGLSKLRPGNRMWPIKLLTLVRQTWKGYLKSKFKILWVTFICSKKVSCHYGWIYVAYNY